MGSTLIGKLFKLGSGNNNSSANKANTTAAKDQKHNKKASSDQSSHSGKKTGNSRGQATSHSPSGSRSNTRSNNRNRSRRQSNRNTQQQDSSMKQANDMSPSWDLSQFVVPEQAGKTRFHDLDLPEEVMHAIADLGFEYCSPIQARSLPYALNGQDVVGKAQTGTGKTAAFLLAIIDDLIKHPLTEERFAGEARALIIAPTRELVLQIGEDAKLLTTYTDLKVQTLVGGMDYGKQQRRLHDELVDIVVATPGRLLDFCGNQDIYLDQVEVLVIDEADRMLDMGFIPQLRRIIRLTPQKSHRQTLMFSATFSDDVKHLIEQWTVDRVTVEIEPESVATATVDQRVYLASANEKYKLLYNILKQDNVESLIVFANRRDEARNLWEKLKAHGYAAGLLSGEIAQNQRVSTLAKFKDGNLKVLVATDVAGRGIHIDGVSHVVNLTLPEEPEDYIHRIGRTGRAGEKGTSISFACEDDAFRLMPIQQLLGEDLKCEQPPESLLEEPPEVKVPSSRHSNNRARQGNRSGGRRSNRPRS